MHKLKIAFGFGLFIVGVVGTLLPVIPGVPIMIAGFALMGADHPLVRNLKARQKRWFDRKKPAGRNFEP